MLVAAAVCPHPPLLVPGVGAGASGELEGLRAACTAAVATLVGTEHDLLVVLGTAPVTGRAEAEAEAEADPVDAGVTEVLAGYVGTNGTGSGTGLPLSLAVGRWLLGSLAGGPAPHHVVGVPPDTAPAGCAALGAGVAARAERVALLVMADGSARRSPRGPAEPDERAGPVDDVVAAALAAGDAEALAALDPGLADELLVGGRAPWQVLAGAAAAAGRRFHGELRWAGAPYGVTYLVASWR